MEIPEPPRIKHQHRSLRIFWIVSAIVLSFYAGVAWGKKHSPQVASVQPVSSVSQFLKNFANPKDLFTNPDAGKPQKLDFDIFWKAWSEFDQKYVDESKLDPQKRVYGAIKGMVSSIGDPYSGFMDPEETKEFNTDIQGSFEGIGAELGMKEGILTVISPIDGTPAQRAGIQAGDKILKINGELTSDITIDEAVKRIRGPKGTEVTITILRNGRDKTEDITMKRETIQIKSVIYEKKADGIAYIRVTKFAEDTTKEFNRIVSTAIADGTKGIILDVRNNPGGLLNVAIEITSKFVPKGEVVVIEQGRDGQQKKFEAIGGDTFSDIPVVVLINEGSASASEIIAGALRDDRQAALIGRKSFGKGSVQQLEELQDGSSLRITIAKWLTPLGQSIHEVGIKPDIDVELTQEDVQNKQDKQLDRALEEIKQRIP